MTVPDSHPYDRLLPDVILSAAERLGLHCTGGLLALNSYENRVYRIMVEDEPPVVAKFYRPGRWTDEAIHEEHAFAFDLEEQEIPVVAPLTLNGESLHTHEGFRYTLFPWQPGRAPEMNLDEDWRMLGRFLGRLHRVGQNRRFMHRPVMSVEEYGVKAADNVLAASFLPDYLEQQYRDLTQQLLELAQQRYTAFQTRTICLHGDVHLGNLLWTETGPHFVDLDDCISGPAMQDLWMLLNGERQEQELQLGLLLEGYTEFMDFDPVELNLIEVLRSLRLMHYAAWLTRRWDDPAFPRSFPWFNTIRYWEEHIQNLREQLAALQEPPLAWQS